MVAHTALSTGARAALLACLVGTADLAAQSPRELVRDLAGPRADRAEVELQRLGAEAVEALIDAGQLDSRDVRIRCLRTLARIGLRVGDVAEQIVAAYPKGVSDYEELIALLDALGAALPNSERFRRERLAMGSPGKWTIPESWFELVQRIHCDGRPPEQLQRSVRLAQGRMEVRSFFLIGRDSTTRELAVELESKLPLVRELAAELLAVRGASATEAVPALAEALRREHARDVPRVGRSDETDVVHAAAARAILAIAPEHARSGLAHAWVLRSGTDEERLEAVLALTRLGSAAAETVPELVETLDRAELRSGLAAIVALGGIGPAAKAALPRLRELARSDVEEVARRSAAAVRAIERE